MNEDKIIGLLKQLGTALSTRDLPGIVNCWELPALVLSDEGAIAVSEAGEIEKFFGQATEWYRSRGLESTRPELERIEILSENLASVDVRWPSFDVEGEEKFSERSHYLVQLGKDGLVRIRVALTRTR